MVDFRHILGESGHGYPCYLLKPPKISLVVVSGIRSPLAINGFSGARPSTAFQVHGHRRFFMCTAVDVVSGARSHLYLIKI